MHWKRKVLTNFRTIKLVCDSSFFLTNRHPKATPNTIIENRNRFIGVVPRSAPTSSGFAKIAKSSSPDVFDAKAVMLLITNFKTYTIFVILFSMALYFLINLAINTVVSVPVTFMMYIPVAVLFYNFTV